MSVKLWSPQQSSFNSSILKVRCNSRQCSSGYLTLSIKTFLKMPKKIFYNETKWTETSAKLIMMSFTQLYYDGFLPSSPPLAIRTGPAVGDTGPFPAFLQSPPPAVFFSYSFWCPGKNAHGYGLLTWPSLQVKTCLHRSHILANTPSTVEELRLPSLLL